MTSAEVIAKFEPIFRDLFDEYDGPVVANLTANDVAQWDSLAHVQFIVMVEKEFEVRFTSGEVARLMNLGALADAIVTKIN